MLLNKEESVKVKLRWGASPKLRKKLTDPYFYRYKKRKKKSCPTTL